MFRRLERQVRLARDDVAALVYLAGEDRVACAELCRHLEEAQLRLGKLAGVSGAAAEPQPRTHRSGP